MLACNQCKKRIKELSGFPSSYSVFEIWYVFYPYGTSQFELATFHTLPGNMGLIGTELDSPALPHAAFESKYFPTLIERIPCGWFFFHPILTCGSLGLHGNHLMAFLFFVLLIADTPLIPPWFSSSPCSTASPPGLCSQKSEAPSWSQLLIHSKDRLNSSPSDASCVCISTHA